MIKLTPNINPYNSFEIVFEVTPRYNTIEHYSIKRITFINLCQFYSGMNEYGFRHCCSEKKWAKIINITEKIRAWSKSRVFSFDLVFF